MSEEADELEKLTRLQLKLPPDLEMSTVTHQPKFSSDPIHYQQQSLKQKIVCIAIVVFIIALSAVFLYVLVLWTMSTSSTTFGHIWAGIGLVFFFGIAVVNSFQKPSYQKLQLRLKDTSLLTRYSSNGSDGGSHKLAISKTEIYLKTE